MDALELWQKALPEIEEAVKSVVFMNTYLGSARPLAFNNSIFVLYVEMEISKNMIERRHKKQIEECLSRACGYSVKLEITTQLIDTDITHEATVTDISPQKYIDRRYTFDNFVVGPSNEYATDAALKVVKLNNNINPLFLYGSSGLGKTHLMVAIGNKVLENNPDSNVVYVTSEKFTSDFVNLVGMERNGKAFHDKYRNVDILLIDDIQFLIGKEGVQEEFFNTFNELYQAGKQIVITCDRRPSDLRTLSDRLRTRFSQGLIIDINAPIYETRVGIIEKKLEDFNFHLEPDIIDFIATRIKSNVREIEGAIQRLMYDRKINNNAVITLADAEKSLKSILPESKVITPQLIIKKVCEYYNIREDELLGANKAQSFALPRQIAMYLSSELTTFSNTKLGTIFNKERTTVISGIKRVREKMLENDSIRYDINHLTDEINSY